MQEGDGRPAPGKRHESFFKKNGNSKYRIPITGDRSRNGGYLLQRVAFPEAGATNQQILATVYGKNLPAHVSLKSAFWPEQAADLRLTVTVTGPTKEPDPSVLVVQCRSEQGKAKQPTAALWSESASRPQELGKVLVTSQVETSWTDTVTWQGVSGLSPSMSATNLASAARQNRAPGRSGCLQ